MPLSVTAPIDVAMRRTGAILFQPFDAEKWLKLGVCAFLATLGEYGGSNGSSVASEGIDGLGNSPGRALEHAGERLAEHLVPALMLGLLALVVGLALVLLVLWLHSRGTFMFLDGVVRDRGAVRGPWSEYRAEGNSLFGFTLLLLLAGAAISMFALALGLVLAWDELGSIDIGAGTWLALVLGGGTLLLTGLVCGLIALLTNDFVVPAMHARRCGALAGWRAVRAEILQWQLGTIVRYVLMRFAFKLLAVFLLLMLGCGTLGLGFCLMAIPLLGTLVVLPVLVFERCYSLAFLEQFGPAWTLGPAPVPEHTH